MNIYKILTFTLQFIFKMFIVTLLGYCIWYLPNIYFIGNDLTFGNYIQMWDHFNLYVSLLVSIGAIYGFINKINSLHVLNGTIIGQILFLFAYAEDSKFTGLAYFFCVLYTSFTFLSFHFVRHTTSLWKRFSIKLNNRE